MAICYKTVEMLCVCWSKWVINKLKSLREKKENHVIFDLHHLSSSGWEFLMGQQLSGSFAVGWTADPQDVLCGTGASPAQAFPLVITKGKGFCPSLSWFRGRTAVGERVGHIFMCAFPYQPTDSWSKLLTVLQRCIKRHINVFFSHYLTSNQTHFFFCFRSVRITKIISVC